MNKALKLILILILTLVITLLGYVAYVFLSYDRIEDNLSLEVSGIASKGNTIPVNREEPFTLTSWNIGFAAYTDDYTFFMDGGEHSRAFSKEAVIENMDAIGDTLTDMNSDFYLIQEVDIDSDRTYHVNQQDALINKFTGCAVDEDPVKSGKQPDSYTFGINYDSPYLFYPLTEPHGKSVAGIMTLSDYTISSAIRRSLPIQTDFAKFIDLDRCYVINRIPTDDGKELVLINLHLSAYTTDPTIANQQLEMLYEDIISEREKGNYVICGGDFNKDLLGDSSKYFRISGEDYSWAQSFPFNTLPKGFELVAPFNEKKPVASCRNADKPWDPKTNFHLTIDGFIVSDNIEVITSDVVDEDFEYSDHNPVQMEFLFKYNY